MQTKSSILKIVDSTLHNGRGRGRDPESQDPNILHLWWWPPLLCNTIQWNTYKVYILRRTVDASWFQYIIGFLWYLVYAMTCGALSTVYCTLYITHFTLHCKLYTVLHLFCTVLWTLYTVDCTLYNVLVTLYTSHFPEGCWVPDVITPFTATVETAVAPRDTGHCTVYSIYHIRHPTYYTFWLW